MKGLHLHQRMSRWIVSFQKHVNRTWYAPLLGLIAALDCFVLVIPTDGILISSAMLRPKRWLILAVCTAIGSTFGAMLFAALVEYHGLPWILEIYPTINSGAMWSLATQFFERFGLLLVFAVAAAPITQHPIVILAVLAKVSLFKLGLVMLAGRLFKCLIMAYVASHAPRLLAKMWGVMDELKDAGVKLD